MSKPTYEDLECKIAALQAELESYKEAAIGGANLHWEDRAARKRAEVERDQLKDRVYQIAKEREEHDAKVRRAGMEDAAQACRDEQVSSESQHPGDIAYNNACRDCEAAIRAAIDKEDK